MPEGSYGLISKLSHQGHAAPVQATALMLLARICVAALAPCQRSFERATTLGRVQMSESRRLRP